jgi:hypothetical protein
MAFELIHKPKWASFDSSRTKHYPEELTRKTRVRWSLLPGQWVFTLLRRPPLNPLKWYNFLYFQYLAILVLGSNIVIKDVDKAVYRSLKGEAIKAGLKVGDAASQAFRLWVQQRSLGRVRDREAMRRASRDMDLRRAKIGTVKGWSSTDVIRKWRELRRP